MQTSDFCARKQYDRYSVVSSKLVSDVDEQIFTRIGWAFAVCEAEPAGVLWVSSLLAAGRLLQAGFSGRLSPHTASEWPSAGAVMLV